MLDVWQKPMFSERPIVILSGEDFGLADEQTRVVFFFQAEDGIRDVAVTGVQTCALPILDVRWRGSDRRPRRRNRQSAPRRAARGSSPPAGPEPLRRSDRWPDSAPVGERSALSSTDSRRAGTASTRSRSQTHAPRTPRTTMALQAGGRPH